MSFPDYPTYRSVLQSPHQPIVWTKTVTIANISAAGSVWCSSWLSAPGAGSAPGAAATCDRTTAGAFGQTNAASELRLWVEQLQYSSGSNNQNSGTIMLCDRLCHMSGLDGTSVAAQTVATPAIPRYVAANDRLCAAAEIYTSIGATATTLTCSYTNQSGTSGQISQPVAIGGTNNRLGAGLFLPISMAAGDTGFASVETATLAASTLTVGNWGITIYKPLFTIPIFQPEDNGKWDPVTRLGALMPLIQPGACLFALVMPLGAPSGAGSFLMDAKFNFFED